MMVSIGQAMEHAGQFAASICDCGSPAEIHAKGVTLGCVYGPDIKCSRYVDWYGKERRQNWRTPVELFDKWHGIYGFTMDGASEPGNGLLPKASTAEAQIPWDGERVFCNPPWSNIAPFLEHATKAACAVFLVPARTNARWFHRALELGAEPVFFSGRPRFQGGKHTSPVDCMLLVFGA